MKFFKLDDEEEDNLPHLVPDFILEIPKTNFITHKSYCHLF